MPFRQPPLYGMICFDADGNERLEKPDDLMSDRLEDLAASGRFTNIFLFAHGWKTDVPKAWEQFDLWIGALEAHTADRARAGSVFPNFKPLYIGIHWPSLAGGDESLPGPNPKPAGLDKGQPPARQKPLTVEQYLELFGKKDTVRDAVELIDDYERHPTELTDKIREAGQTLIREIGLSDADIDGQLFRENDEAQSYGAPLGFLSRPLANLTYWTMKKRARSIGENAGHNFLKRLQRATAAKHTPIHLMGHSFGCVFMSSILGGPGACSPLERPVDSVALIQGAVSLWSYASELAYGPGPGYFHRVVADGKIRGPLIVTRSKCDSAVNIPYKAASAVARDQAFALGDNECDESDYYTLTPPPKYGAIGRFGIRSHPVNSLPVNDLLMKDQNESYAFQCGQIYNLDSSKYISKNEGFGTGAHNDIGGPQVAHAIWEAAFHSARRPER